MYIDFWAKFMKLIHSDGAKLAWKTTVNCTNLLFGLNKTLTLGPYKKIYMLGKFTHTEMYILVWN